MESLDCVMVASTCSSLADIVGISDSSLAGAAVPVVDKEPGAAVKGVGAPLPPDRPHQQPRPDATGSSSRPRPPEPRREEFIQRGPLSEETGRWDPCHRTAQEDPCDLRNPGPPIPWNRKGCQRRIQNRTRLTHHSTTEQHLRILCNECYCRLHG
ncbi:hypothetical protein NDU88_006654 [Pleurodeles waltl]|uniref:Uncharacterized protein n=1 Tax=Pleurodeles waltl TaxID=8319 RepID=A0AAV7VQ90_PLEWA|nr:hypothetical protein NDU88_006654 [Pleurodeles waltl]